MSCKEIFKKEAKLDELNILAKEIISYLPKEGAIVLLNGDLAAGKTTLVSKFVEILSSNKEVATSPTFSLQQCYGDNIFHYDFYRVDFIELLDLGLLEEFEKKGFHFVEWANEELVELLIKAGFKIYSIDIRNLQSNREYSLKDLSA